MSDESRFERGLKKLHEVDGNTGIGITESLNMQCEIFSNSDRCCLFLS